MPRHQVGGEEGQRGKQRDHAERQRRNPAAPPAREGQPANPDPGKEIQHKEQEEAPQQPEPAIRLAGFQHNALQLDTAAFGIDNQGGLGLRGGHISLHRYSPRIRRQADAPHLDV